MEKLRYIHQNPVKRGLCARAEDWEWSSFRQYATGCAEWRLNANGQRGSKNERQGDSAQPQSPLKPKNGLSGSPARFVCGESMGQPLEMIDSPMVRGWTLLQRKC
jgi:hypothetical protein